MALEQHRSLLNISEAVQKKHTAYSVQGIYRQYPKANLEKYPVIEYKIDTAKLGYIVQGQYIPDVILDMPFQIVNDEEGFSETTLRQLSTKQYLILDFWARWCKLCMVSMAKWEAMRPDIHDKIRVVR